jgi:hypothetical protein
MAINRWQIDVVVWIDLRRLEPLLPEYKIGRRG